MATAVSSASTTLYSGAVGGTPAFTELVEIISYPDLGSAPSKLDSTTLKIPQGGQKTNILGLQDAPDLEFEANFDKAKYASIKAMAGTTRAFKLGFGNSDADGYFTWEGTISVYANGAGVDEVRKMTISISASTQLTFVSV